MIVTDEMKILLSINGAASYTTTINEVTNVTKNYRTEIGSLISTLGKLVTVGYIVKIGKQCIETADNIDRLRRVSVVTFGAMAEGIEKWTKAEAANYGLTQQNSRNYLNNYGILAKQLNFTTDQATKMSVEMTKLVGNVSAFYNITEKQAAEKLEGILTGYTKGLRDLGLIMTDTNMDAYLLAKGINASYKELDEQGKAVVRYQYALEKLSVTEGAYQANTGSYANSVKELNIELERVKLEVGQQLIPAAVQGLSAVNGVVKVIGPAIITVAQYVRLYAQAWAQASSTIKSVVAVSTAAIAIFWVWPKVVAMATAAQKLLTTQIVSTGMAIRYTLGVLGIFLGLLALFRMAKSAADIKSTENQIAKLGNSADTSSGAVETLADSLDDLGDSSKGLNTFLASFDEVNKVGGSGSLMSSLVTAQDLANILGAATGIDELQDSLNSLTIPGIGEDTIFSADWWKEKGKMLMGFINTWIDPKEYWDNWKRGFYAIDDFIKEMMPQWHAFFEDLGQKIYDALNPDSAKADKKANKLLGMSSSETFTFTDDNGNRRSVLKYDSSGATSALWNKYGSRAWENGGSRTATATTSNNPIQVNSTIQLDGRTIASVVQEYQNKRTRSSGYSAALS